jgi:hypothetical protein
MADDKSQVLAARVLSYLKRRSGKGNAPSRQETQAAAVALQLLASSIQGGVGDASKLLERLKQMAQKNDTGPTIPSQNDNKYQQSLLSDQQALARLNEMYQLISNVLQMQHDTQKAIISNIR